MDVTKEVVVAAGQSTGTNNTITLDYGDYTITEITDQLNGTNALADGTKTYTWLADESTTATESAIELRASGASFTATNVYDRDEADLTISKKVEGDATYGLPDGAKTEKEYTFTIAGPSDANGTYSIQNSAKTVTFTSGSAEVTITGEADLVIENLPTGTYTVTEQSAKIDNDQHWTWSSTVKVNTDVSTDGKITLTKDAAGTVEVTNTYTRNTGALTIAKTVAGHGADEAKSKTFTFIITAENAIAARDYTTSVDGVKVNFDGTTTAEAFFLK